MNIMRAFLLHLKTENRIKQNGIKWFLLHLKTETVCQRLTSPRFRQRVEAIVEAFSSMQEDFDKEKKAIMV